MSFIQSIIKNVLNATQSVRKTAGKVAIVGAKNAGTTLERGATFFKNIAERYDSTETPPTTTVAEVVTPVVATPPPPVAKVVTPVVATPPTAKVAEVVTPVAETPPTATVAEVVTPVVETPVTATVAETTPLEAGEGFHENTVTVYHAIVEGFNQNGETPSQGRLATMTGFSKSTVSRHVGLLEEGGYIKRADDKSRKIMLTDKKLSA